MRFQKEAGYRIDKPDYAERAITEVIVNALIHRSYLLPGSEIHIDMYDNPNYPVTGVNATIKVYNSKKIAFLLADL